MPTQQDIQLYVYTDDITITCKKEHIKDAKDRIQKYLKELWKWSEHWGLEISKTKTKMQYFTHKRIIAPTIRTNNYHIEYVKDMTLLGIKIDAPKLTFKTHILYLREDCLKRINILKALASTYWGASAKVLKTFYIMYIRSKLAYGIEIYVAAANRLLRKLDVLQNACLRLIIGARKSSPITSLEAETGIPALGLFRDFCSSNAYAKRLYRIQEDLKVKILNLKA